MNVKNVMSSKNENWETPQWLFEKLDSVFSFNLDPCASNDNKKCKEFYTIEQDGLKQDWSGTVLNPPYGNKQKLWIQKALSESKKGVTVLCIVPSRTETKNWHQHIFPNAAVVCFLEGRVKFLLNGKEQGSPPFPSAIFVFGQEITFEQFMVLETLGYCTPIVGLEKLKM